MSTVSIKKNYEFKRIYKKGKSFVNPVIVVYILKNRCDKNRIGVTTSKKIGIAVHRNRARRIIHEAFRQLENKLPIGYDFVFVARTRTCVVKEQDVFRAMNGIFISAKLLIPKISTNV